MKHCSNPKCEPFCKCKNKCDCETCKKFRSRHLMQVRGTETTASIYQKGGLKFESTSPDLVIHTKDEGNFSTTITFEPLESAFQKKTGVIIQQIANVMDYQDSTLEGHTAQIEALESTQSDHHEQIISQRLQQEAHTQSLLSHAKDLANHSASLESHTDTLIALSDELVRLEGRLQQSLFYPASPILTGKIYAAASHIQAPIMRIAKEENISAKANATHSLLLEQTKGAKRLIAYGGCFDIGDGNKLPLPYFGPEKSAYLFINKDGVLQLDTLSPHIRKNSAISIWAEFTQ